MRDKIDKAETSFSKDVVKTINKGLKQYKKGRYDKALKFFEKSRELDARVEYKLYPYMEKCNRVHSIKLSEYDYEYIKDSNIRKVSTLLTYMSIFFGLYILSELKSEDDIFNSLVRLFFGSIKGFFLMTFLVALIYSIKRLFKISSSTSSGKLRCKYCGHYTQYIDPEEPTFGASVGENFCSVCNRSYPMPNSFWDSWEGLHNMYSRHSVYEAEFYEEYERLRDTEKSLKKKFF
ncbi:MAG: tetratricopeptide repeat protein [Candidatus Marinimicrobia bacterium]|nr:tetratricopeptide repeat protein [Candidatus Neomarinimicrobiota bacterium]